MPKIKWAAAGDDDVLTADDIDSAEDGFQSYTGDIPPGGVYRFRMERAKYSEFSSGNQGFNVLAFLDGTWKPEHAKYDGCPLWDRVVMTKAAAGFAKAFAAALGVTSADLISKVIVDEDGYVTKIGSKTIGKDILLYIAVKRGSYNDEQHLEKAGVGYQVVENQNGSDDPWASDSAKPDKGKGKAKKDKAGKAKKDDDAPPF